MYGERFKYLICLEDGTQYATAETAIGAWAMSIWVGLWSWLLLNPQRVMVATLRDEFVGKVPANLLVRELSNYAAYRRKYKGA